MFIRGSPALQVTFSVSGESGWAGGVPRGQGCLSAPNSVQDRECPPETPALVSGCVGSDPNVRKDMVSTIMDCESIYFSARRDGNLVPQTWESPLDA